MHSNNCQFNLVKEFINLAEGYLDYWKLIRTMNNECCYDFKF